MLRKKKIKKLVILIAICTAIKIVSFFPTLIEHFYSRGIYPCIAGFLRLLLGWIPISIGDILYLLAITYGLYRTLRLIYKLIILKKYKPIILQALVSIAIIVLWTYIFFNLLWGLNYNREEISLKLQLNVKENYSTSQLDILVKALVSKANLHRTAMQHEKIDSSFANLQEQALIAYKNTESIYPFLKYNTKSIKRPLYNTLGNYLGYSGYINPFTNEAQVGTKQPASSLPFIICHEMAHQIGYGPEDEANFIGYITATHSDNNYFKYTAYLQLYRYANRELFYRDSTLAKNNYNQLDTLVKSDILYSREFFRNYESIYEKYVSKIYNQFLKANEQPQGLDTYNKVTGWLLAYQEKYKRL